MGRTLPRHPAAWIPLGVTASFLFFLFAPASPRVVRAAERVSPPGDTMRVYGPFDTIEVVSQPPDRLERIDRLPTFAVVRDLDAYAGRVASIADVLEETAGVRVRRYGGLGAYATASIRASSPGQVEVYLDGVPVNSAEWGVTNLADIPIDNLDHLEIYRSGAPLEFGTAGIGGVVNLVTRPAGRDRTIVSQAEGSYGTWKTGILHSGNAAGFGHLVSYRRLSTRGDFTFHYDPGTPVLNGGDDQVLTRRNNDFTEHSLLVKLDAPPLAGWRFNLRDDWFLKESGLPGHGNLLYQQASFDNRRHMATLNARSPWWFGHRLRADAGAFHHYRRDRYYNPGREPGLNLTDLEQRTRSDGADLQLTAPLPALRQSLQLRGELRREGFVPRDSDPRVGEGFERERRLVNLGAQDELALRRDRLIVLASWRYQESRDNFFGPVPFGRPPEERSSPHGSTFHGPALGARFVAHPDLVLKANRTEYARFPTLFELFGTGGEVRASPELVPETGVTWDAGARWTLPSRSLLQGTLEVSAYHSDRDSIIYFVQNSQRNFRALNLEHVTAKGIEAQWDLRAPPPAGLDGLRLEGSLTVQEARHEGTVPHWNGKWLPYVSPRELFLRTSAEAGRFALRHEYSWFDRYYVDRANIEENRAEARSLQNAGASAHFLRRRMTLDMTVENLFDRKVEDVFGYPMPGRTFYLTLELDLGARRDAREGRAR